MSQKFQSSIQHRADVSYVKLGGVIDEDNELADLADKIPVGTAVIDLGEIERINSCGVRDWVNWLARLETGGTRSVLVECSPAIVAQINLVNNFTGNGVVKSFYVPYFCPECDEEKVLLVEATDMGPPPHEPPTCRCDECDLVMDFDDMPDSYFAFLSNQKKLAEPDKINGAMRDLHGSEPELPKGKVRSRASQPNLSSGAKPSVPSLPSIQRTSTGPTPMVIQATGSRGFTNPPSRPQLGLKPPTGPGPGHSRPPGQLGSMSSAGQVNHGGQVHGGQMAASGPHMAPPGYGFAGQAQIQGQAQAQVQNHGHAHGQVHAHGHHHGAQAAGPPRGSALVYVLIVVLMAAIGVLAYLVLTK